MKKVLFLSATASMLATGIAQGQPTNPDPPYEAGESARGVRGAIGMGLIGMELTMTIEAAAGVKNPWLLSLIPLAVGGGAAAGGYFLEQESSGGGIAVLAVGATLLVPSILLTLVLSAEEVEAQERTTTTRESVPPPSGGAGRSAASPSLVAFRNGGMHFGLPSLTVAEGPARSLYAPAASTGWEYRLALASWVF